MDCQECSIQALLRKGCQQRQRRLLRVSSFKPPRMEITPLVQAWVSLILKFSFSPAFSEIPAVCVCCLVSLAKHIHSSTHATASLRGSRSLSQPFVLTTKPSQHPEPAPSTAPRAPAPRADTDVISGVLRRGEAFPPSVCSLPSWPSETPEMPPALAGHQE